MSHVGTRWVLDSPLTLGTTIRCGRQRVLTRVLYLHMSTWNMLRQSGNNHGPPPSIVYCCLHSLEQRALYCILFASRPVEIYLDKSYDRLWAAYFRITICFSALCHRSSIIPRRCWKTRQQREGLGASDKGSESKREREGGGGKWPE